MKPLNLCLLDLDHTLIYGSYAPSEKADILFQYSEYLKVYKRPFVNQFVAKLSQSYNDIIVFTTAKRDYAEKICQDLNINTKQLLTRNDCLSKNDSHYKIFKAEWGELYDNIHIIDDSPNVWLKTDKYESKIKFIVPKEYRGEPEDNELLLLINQY